MSVSALSESYAGVPSRMSAKTLALLQRAEAMAALGTTSRAIGDALGISDGYARHLLAEGRAARGEQPGPRPASVSRQPEPTVRLPRKPSERAIAYRVMQARFADPQVSTLTGDAGWLWAQAVREISRRGDGYGMDFAAAGYEGAADFAVTLRGTEDDLALLIRRGLLIEADGGLALPKHLEITPRQSASRRPAPRAAAAGTLAGPGGAMMQVIEGGRSRVGSRPRHDGTDGSSEPIVGAAPGRPEPAEPASSLPISSEAESSGNLRTESPISAENPQNTAIAGDSAAKDSQSAGETGLCASRAHSSLLASSSLSLEKARDSERERERASACEPASESEIQPLPPAPAAAQAADAEPTSPAAPVRLTRKEKKALRKEQWAAAVPKPAAPTLLAEDWQPDEKLRADAAKRFKDVDAIIRKFRGHYRSIGAALPNWNAKFEVWLDREATFDPSNVRPPASQAPAPQSRPAGGGVAFGPDPATLQGAERLWARACQEVIANGRISESHFRHWLGKLRFLGRDDGCIRLSAPDGFMAGKINDMYGDPLRRAVARIDPTLGLEIEARAP